MTEDGRNYWGALRETIFGVDDRLAKLATLSAEVAEKLNDRCDKIGRAGANLDSRVGILEEKVPDLQGQLISMALAVMKLTNKVDGTDHDSLAEPTPPPKLTEEDLDTMLAEPLPREPDDEPELDIDDMDDDLLDDEDGWTEDSCDCSACSDAREMVDYGPTFAKKLAKAKEPRPKANATMTEELRRNARDLEAVASDLYEVLSDTVSTLSRAASALTEREEAFRQERRRADSLATGSAVPPPRKPLIAIPEGSDELAALIEDAQRAWRDYVEARDTDADQGWAEPWKHYVEVTKAVGAEIVRTAEVNR